MLCSMCNFKDAVVEKTIDLGYGKVNAYLCEGCALKVKTNECEKEEEISSFWNVENTEIICPRCKQSASGFEKSYYVGCEKCYEIFKPEIERAITIIHGNSHHVGKIPEAVFESQSKKYHKDKTSRNMSDAIDDMDFLSAKKIRDKYFGGDN